MADTKHLLINVILYGLLPLWGIAGFIDWVCHRATHVERTSGLKESLIHSLMGLQLGIPILLCLIFKVNVLIFFICALMWVLHEFVAHWDVLYASPLRRISIWEVHVHNLVGPWNLSQRFLMHGFFTEYLHGRLEKLRNADGPPPFLLKISPAAPIV